MYEYNQRMLREADPLVFTGENLVPHLQQVEDKGATLVRGFLTDVSVDRLQAFCSTLPFKPLHVRRGTVTKKFEYADYDKVHQRALAELGEGVWQRLVQHEGDFPAVSNWVPNDYAVQKYNRDGFVSSHKDAPDYSGLVVVCSVQGEADFEVRNERHGESVYMWALAPGDAVILRAAGFSGNPERQDGPFHLVGGAKTEIPRISIGIAEDPLVYRGLEK